MAEHVLELTGRARLPEAVEVAGVLAAAAHRWVCMYAIGEDRTSPWLEAIAGIRERPCPRLDSKPVPAPRPRSGVRASLSVGFSPPRLQQAPHPERQKMWLG